MTNWVSYLPIAILFGVVLALMGILLGLRLYHQRKKQRSPFSHDLLRGPGHSTLQQLDQVNEELQINVVSIVAIPLAVYALHLSQSYFGGRPEDAWRVLFSVGLGLVVVTYYTFRAVQLINLRRVLRMGLEGETATGQELNQLMLEGYHVYHDFPAERFNIDHIVVGPSGVYAVETKARSKPTTDKGRAAARVVYDGSVLQFPTWHETEPLAQAQQQARWLEGWLHSAVGEQVKVRPVVTLPGWHVERTSSQGIAVVNPRVFASLLRGPNGNPLSKQLIKRIVHQLDQKCRDVAPAIRRLTRG